MSRHASCESKARRSTADPDMPQIIRMVRGDHPTIPEEWSRSPELACNCKPAQHAQRDRPGSTTRKAPIYARPVRASRPGRLRMICAWLRHASRRHCRFDRTSLHGGGLHDAPAAADITGTVSAEAGRLCTHRTTTAPRMRAKISKRPGAPSGHPPHHPDRTPGRISHMESSHGAPKQECIRPHDRTMDTGAVMPTTVGDRSHNPAPRHTPPDEFRASH